MLLWGFCAGPARHCGAAGADSLGASVKYRRRAAEPRLRQSCASLCDYSGALPGFATAASTRGNGGAGFCDPAVFVAADSALKDGWSISEKGFSLRFHGTELGYI